MSARVAPLVVGSAPVRALGLDGPPSGLLAPRPAGADRATQLSVAFPPVGRGPKHTAHLCQGLNDRSPSMGLGNDPSGLRLVAFLRAAQEAARTARPGLEYASLRSFDLASPSDAGQVALDRAGIRSLHSAVDADRICDGVSTISPALAAARQEAVAFEGEVSLVILSDFLLTDTESLPVLLGDYPADRIHLVALTASVPGAFVDHPSITSSSATWQDDPAEVALTIFRQMTALRSPVTTSMRRSRHGRAT